MGDLLTLVLALGLAHAPAQTPASATNPTLIRVFVQTEDSGETSELAGRRQSVRDLTSALASKKKTLTVADEDSADVVLEVVDRGVNVPKVVMGLGARPGDPTSIPGMNGPVRVVVLRVKLTTGHEFPVFTNKNKPAESARGWKSAADDIGNQVEKWIGERREEILKRRRQ